MSDDDEFVEDEYEHCSEESNATDDLDDESEDSVEQTKRQSASKKSPSLGRSRFKGRVIRVQQTDDGASLNILRAKMEDKKFDGSSVKQQNVVNYLTSVLCARHEFYAEMWKNMSNVLLDCVDEVPTWTRSTRKSQNINRWLGTSSVGFCVSSVAKSIKVTASVKKETKPMGRPVKRDDQLKTPRRYVLKKRNSNSRSCNTPSSATHNLATSLVSEETNDQPQCSTKIERIPIFESRSFPFAVRNMNYGGMESGLSIRDVAQELVGCYSNVAMNPSLAHNVYKGLSSDFFNNLKERIKKPILFQTLFCGGPLSAMAVCSRRSLSGDEVVAISTFADEKLLAQLDDVAHVQFWTYTSDLSSPAKLKFILEIPDVSHVLSLCWCPAFTDKFYSSLSRTNNSSRRFAHEKASEHFTRTENTLGFLAVGTNVGKVLIYCIPRDLDILSDDHSKSKFSARTRGKTARSAASKTTNPKSQADTNQSASSSNEAPPICMSSPKFMLRHPSLTMRIDEGSQQIFFKKVPKAGRCAAGPSASIAQYHDTMQNSTTALKDFDDFPIISLSWSPFERCDKIAGVSAGGRVLIWDITKESDVPSMIYSPLWTSPPVTVTWVSKDEIGVSFRLKCSRVYNIKTDTCIFKEDTAKTAGQFIYNNPIILPGFFAYDTSALTFFDIFFSCSTYTYFDTEDRKRAVVVPLFNSHQVQVSRLNACETSGCVMTAGFDGRLYVTLNGRIVPHFSELRSAFNIGRTILHILPHSNQRPPQEVLRQTITDTSTKRPPAKKSKKGGANKVTVTASNDDNTEEEEISQTNITQIKCEAIGDEEYADTFQKTKPAQENSAASEDGPAKLCFSHVDCCENKWLEVRVGDAAMKDQVSLRRVKTKVQDVVLDRRLEALSFVEFSHLTPCLSISGGEAGLVFLMPCVF